MVGTLDTAPQQENNNSWMTGGDITNGMKVEVYSITTEGDDLRGRGQVFNVTRNSFFINYEGESAAIEYGINDVTQTIKVREV